MARGRFEIGDVSVAPGARETVDLAVTAMSDHTPVNLSVHVVHGRRPGPVLFVSAAIHGDEVIGVEIVRRLLKSPKLDSLRGTLLAVPVVNTFGFLNHSRYLPDRRDLNRSFPGSSGGSLAARLAHRFVQEVVARADVGIDLHSAAVGRENLPQVRVSPGDRKAMVLARAFGAPVLLSSKLRDGSLRATARERGVPMVLFEGGEGLRFDEFTARAGVTGCLRVMRALDMVTAKGVARPRARTLVAEGSGWIRSPSGGLFRAWRQSGEVVAAGEAVGAVADPFGDTEAEVLAEAPGIVIGRSNLPVVNEGDALFHIAHLPDPGSAEVVLERMTEQLDGDPMFDEDEII